MRTFDFNALTQPTLEVKLGNLELHVTTPPERMIEQLASAAEELTALAESGNVLEQSRVSYQYVAELLSCNTEGITFTADDLRDKYRLSSFMLTAFVVNYMDFINEIHNAKN